jgi:hypothetical protein
MENMSKSTHSAISELTTSPLPASCEMLGLNGRRGSKMTDYTVFIEYSAVVVICGMVVIWKCMK